MYLRSKGKFSFEFREFKVNFLQDLLSALSGRIGIDPAAPGEKDSRPHTGRRANNTRVSLSQGRHEPPSSASHVDDVHVRITRTWQRLSPSRARSTAAHSPLCTLCWGRGRTSRANSTGRR